MTKEKPKDTTIQLGYGFYTKPGNRGSIQLHRTTQVEKIGEDKKPTGEMVNSEATPSYHSNMEQAIHLAAKILMNEKSGVGSAHEHIEERTRIYNNMLHKATSHE